MKRNILLAVVVGIMGTSACVYANSEGKGEPTAGQHEQEPTDRRHRESVRVTLEWDRSGRIALIDERGRRLEPVPIREHPIKASQVRDVKTLTLMQTQGSPCRACFIADGLQVCYPPSPKFCP